MTSTDIDALLAKVDGVLAEVDSTRADTPEAGEAPEPDAAPNPPGEQPEQPHTQEPAPDIRESGQDQGPAATPPPARRSVRLTGHTPGTLPPPGRHIDLSKLSEPDTCFDQEERPEAEEVEQPSTSSPTTEDAAEQERGEEEDGQEETSDRASRERRFRLYRREENRPTPEAAWDWVRNLSHRRRTLLSWGSAAATGAWGYGAFTGEWDTGIPQTVLAWMHDAAATSESAVTPWIIGGLAVLVAAAAGSAAYGFISRFLAHVPAACAVFHWALVRVPVISTTVALLIFTRH